MEHFHSAKWESQKVKIYIITGKSNKDDEGFDLFSHQGKMEQGDEVTVQGNGLY
jgi:hypothetical protein